MNMDEDWVEEELLVYVDYGTFVSASEIADPDMQFNIIGLDQNTVHSEINGKLFSGTYTESVGTRMFFAEDPNQSKVDNIFQRTPETLFSLEAVTEKVITMKREFVERKEGTEAEEVADPNEYPTGRRKYQVQHTYQEALDSLLKVNQLPPRTVTDSLDYKIMLQRGLEKECDEPE